MENYGVFLKEVYKELSQIRAEEFQGILQEELLSDSVQWLSVKGADDTPVPAVYLPFYYQDAQKGMDMQEIVADICKQCAIRTESERYRKAYDFGDYQKMKDKIRVRLLNYRNYEPYIRLEDALAFPFFDMTFLFYIQDEKDGEDLEWCVTRKLAVGWNVSCEELYQQAVANCMEGAPVLLESLGDTLFQMTGAKEEGMETGLYLMSNQKYTYGAVYALFPEMLAEICRKLGLSVFLLPSSVHEFLILPDTGYVDAQDMNALVRTVNKEHVREREVLSDHLFRYDAADGEIRMYNGNGDTWLSKDEYKAEVHGMDYEAFKKAVEERLNAILPDGAVMQMVDTCKANQGSQEGISIRLKDAIIGPIFYLNLLLAEYQKGRTIDEICSWMLEKTEDNEIRDLSFEWMSDYKQVKDRLVLRLLSADSNAEMLKNVPLIKFHDMALVVYINVSTPIAEGYSLVNQFHLKDWNITEKQLFSDAKKSSAKIQPCKLCSAGVMNEEKEEHKLSGVHILTNEEQSFGAATIFYPGALEKCAERLDGSYFMFTLGFHAWMLLSPKQATDCEKMCTVIAELQNQVIDSQNMLTNQVFYYDADTHELSAIGE